MKVAILVFTTCLMNNPDICKQESIEIPPENGELIECSLFGIEYMKEWFDANPGWGWKIEQGYNCSYKN